MKRTSAIILSALLILLVAGGIVYYKYNHIDTVTDYARVKVTHSTDNYLGGYSNSETEIEPVGQYASDSIAEAREHEDFLRDKRYLRVHMEKDVASEKDEMVRQAKAEAYRELLSEERTLISITHVRSLGIQPLLKLIKQHGLGSVEVGDYIKRNKVQMAIYPL